MFAASEEAACYWVGRIAIGTASPVTSKNNGDMAEWSIAGDCKSLLKGAVVRIHLAPPNTAPKMMNVCAAGNTHSTVLIPGGTKFRRGFIRVMVA